MSTMNNTITTTPTTEVKAKTDLYQMVTDRIIKQLEIGVIPWKKPWAKINGGAFNRVTGRPYGLFNQMCLQHEGEYSSFARWTELGGRIKQGEKAETIVFFKKLEPEETETATTESAEVEAREVEETAKPKYVLRYYKVFHISQVLGVSPLPKVEEHEHNRVQEAENLAKDYIEREGITLEEVLSNEAYYSPAEDLIRIPALSQYKNLEEYYGTLFHEMVHSTGTAERLNRPGLAKAGFGTEEYSKEELIAEIGAATLLNGFSIETESSFENSVAYIEGWIQKLRDDKYLIINAARAAEKAAKFIMNLEAVSAS